jgi:hypothetical protein
MKTDSSAWPLNLRDVEQPVLGPVSFLQHKLDIRILLLLLLLDAHLSGCHVLMDCAAASPWYARAAMS